MNEILCRSIEQYFAEVTAAVREHGWEKAVPCDDVRSRTLGLAFPDRSVIVAANQVYALGYVDGWVQRNLALPDGRMIQGLSRFDSEKAVRLYHERIRAAVEKGEALRRADQASGA